MKKIVRILGGALILLVMIVALVSCDDLLLPGGQQGGPLDGLLAELLDGVPGKEEFGFPVGVPQKPRDATEQAIQTIQLEMARITGELDLAKQRTKNIQELPDTFDDLMDDLGTVMGDLLTVINADEEKFYPRMDVFSFDLLDKESFYIEENGYIQMINADDSSGFQFTRTFTDETNKAHIESFVGVNVEFEITGLDGLNGEYQIEFLANAAGEYDANWDDDMTLSGTLTNLDNDEQQLTDDDLLDDWKQVGAEPHQKILTLFMEYFRTTTRSKKSATQVFYPQITGDDLHGEFRFGLVSFYEEAGGGEEEVPIYLSFLWKGGPDNKEYYVVYSTHEEYEDIVAINGVAYEFIPK